MTAQEDTNSPQVKPLVEVYDDADDDGSDDRRETVAGVAALAAVAGIAGAAVAGQALLAVGLAVAVVLFGAALATGVLTRP